MQYQEPVGKSVIRHPHLQTLRCPQGHSSEPLYSSGKHLHNPQYVQTPWIVLPPLHHSHTDGWFWLQPVADCGHAKDCLNTSSVR